MNIVVLRAGAKFIVFTILVSAGQPSQYVLVQVGQYAGETAGELERSH